MQGTSSETLSAKQRIYPSRPQRLCGENPKVNDCNPSVSLI